MILYTITESIHCNDDESAIKFECVDFQNFIYLHILTPFDEFLKRYVRDKVPTVEKGVLRV